jgi:Lrp/AsnC family transcriptional regulator, leucine-responsive regulatory protein
MEIDELDKKILRLLQTNSQLTYKEIADRVHLTVTPVHDRIKKLEKEGFITNYVAVLDKRKLGKSLLVYSQVTLIKQTKDVSSIFNEAIKQLPEVQECHFVSGTFDYLLKILVPDMESYHQFHQEKLSVIDGVSIINSFFVMSEVKNQFSISI